jgi:hypothetical protein
MLISRHFILGLVFMMSSCTDSNRQRKSVNFYNDATEGVYVYSIRGITAYSKGKGPQELRRGLMSAGSFSAYNTYGPIYIDFPISIESGFDSWSYNDITQKVPSPQGKIQSFETIDGIDGDKIEAGGALVIVFGQDHNWYLEFIPGNAYVHPHDLEAKYGISK